MTNEQIERLNNFKIANKPKAPVYAHLAEIYELRDSGFSVEQIIKYLKENYSVSTSSRTLSRVFAAKSKSSNIVVAQENELKKDANSKISVFFPNQKKDNK
nr:hypothetical protein [uncultured Sulfurimonas sp.]